MRRNVGVGTDGCVSALPLRSFFLLEKPLPKRDNMEDIGFLLLFELLPVDVEAPADDALMVVTGGVAGSAGRLLVRMLAPSIR